MASDNEPAKLLLPYLQRADELQKHEPLVAYYSRLYAMEKGLKIPQAERTKTTNSLLVSLMKQLEKDKKSLHLGPEDNLHVEGFALNVFGKADKQDRAGRADLNTAKTFYAASIFFEILNQFGPLQPDLEQKQKYAVWKAADIRKALKEGRKPNPGPPADDEDLFQPSSTYEGGPTSPGTVPDQSPHVDDQSNDHHPITPPSSQFHEADSHPFAGYPPPDFHQNLPPPSRPEDSSPFSQPYHDFHPNQPDPYNHQSYSPPPHNYPPHEPSYSYPNFQSYPNLTDTTLPAVPTHQPYYQASDSSNSAPTVQPCTNTYKYDSNYQPPPEKIAEAHKAARFAVGALAFDDVSVAVEHLRKSLELLTNPSIP